jgi:hypothetical protein
MFWEKRIKVPQKTFQHVVLTVRMKFVLRTC